jgi:hypothetical protein
MSLSLLSDSELVVNMEAGHRKNFDFDRVFGPDSTQGETVSALCRFESSWPDLCVGG